MQMYQNYFAILELLFPKPNLKGKSQWQSLFSWFEELEPIPVFVRQAFNTRDIVGENDVTFRVLEIYSLVEKRLKSESISKSNFEKLVDNLHKSSLQKFTNVLSKDSQKLVGID